MLTNDLVNFERRKVILSYLFSFIQWNTNGNAGDEEYTCSVIVIVVGRPQHYTRYLEYIERIQNLKLTGYSELLISQSVSLSQTTDISK